MFVVGIMQIFYLSDKPYSFSAVFMHFSSGVSVTSALFSVGA
jgi:hypothetical protein